MRQKENPRPTNTSRPARTKRKDKGDNTAGSQIKQTKRIVDHIQYKRTGKAGERRENRRKKKMKGREKKMKERENREAGGRRERERERDRETGATAQCQSLPWRQRAPCDAGRRQRRIAPATVAKKAPGRDRKRDHTKNVDLLPICKRG
jgi:hypothetical protein